MAMASDHLRGRIDIRVANPSDEERLRLAASLADVPVTRFMLGASLERAGEIIGSHTTVPAAYFDQLIKALEAPAEVVPRLAAQSARPRRSTWLG